jgi:hypothetical protein
MATRKRGSSPTGEPPDPWSRTLGIPELGGFRMCACVCGIARRAAGPRIKASDFLRAVKCRTGRSRTPFGSATRTSGRRTMEQRCRRRHDRPPRSCMLSSADGSARCSGSSRRRPPALRVGSLRRLRHFQRPASSDLALHASELPCGGHGAVARGRHGRVVSGRRARPRDRRGARRPVQMAAGERPVRIEPRASAARAPARRGGWASLARPSGPPASARIRTEPPHPAAPTHVRILDIA